jgi:uncharacterized protein (DUF433 family)
MARLDLNALRQTPAYPFAEAAHYLNLPLSTLRSWCLGQPYHDRHGRPGEFLRVIRLDGQRGEGLSFLNLVEAHVLKAIRRAHGISLPKVRKALLYVGSELKIERPLVNAKFQTNGIDLFVDQIGSLLNVSRHGQLEMTDLLRTHLERVTWDDAGIPIKLYPFTRKHAAPDAPSPIEIDPRVAFGRPVLKGRGVPTAILADRFKAGDTLSVLAGDYDTSTEEIEEAIRCELDRKAA